jgi:hypothetical protein
MTAGSTLNRQTFATIYHDALSETSVRLENRAVLANSLAKVLHQPDARRAAYRLKSRALDQGLRINAFEILSDDQGRHHLSRVRLPSGRILHLPLDGIGTATRMLPSVRARLGLPAPSLSSATSA